MTKTMTDHQGFEVPVVHIDKDVRAKNRKAVSLIKKAAKLHDNLKKFKAEFFETMDNFYQLDAEKAGVIGKGKGGYSITSFNKEVKMEINVSQSISFDDNISFAQQLINDYIAEKVKGEGDNDISLLINHAFSVRKGKLDKGRLIGLFQLKIKNDKWKKAMDIIRESMNTGDSKRYLRISKKDKNGEYKDVQLNISAL